jgi:hypothetical protein
MRGHKMLISSQRYLDDQLVQKKREGHDYTVTISPEFVIDGDKMQVIIDGHHSYAAAKADGVEPDFIVASIQDDDRLELMGQSIDDYLETNYIDSDWYDIETGYNVF